jgi:hypothetical protein
MLALTSLESGGRSVGIVRSKTQATEFSLVSWHSAGIIFSLLNAVSNIAGAWKLSQNSEGLGVEFMAEAK